MGLTENRIAALDLLRGLAACSVMLFHFTIKETICLSDSNILKLVGQFGHYGVQVFFMISGFVIPYSQWRKSYTVSDFKRFMMKRILRIEIPFLAIIVAEILLIIISSLTPWRAGLSDRLDVSNILLHIGYLNGFLGRPWLLPIFWTLAIEFQFYLFMALLFNVIFNSKPIYRYLIFIAMAGSSFVVSNNLLFHHSIFFIIGMQLFQFHTKSISRIEFLTSIGISFMFLAITQNVMIIGLCTASCLAILFLDRISPLYYQIGLISFSLYLVHIPFGGRVLALVEVLTDNEIIKSIAIVITFAMTLLIARLFYLLIERPALMLSRKY